MTTFPLADCCKMLAIDPKTLHRWLSYSNMPLHAHPTDARLKCLTIEQVQQLAAVHGRPFQSHPCAIPALLEGAPPQAQPEMPAQPEPAYAATSVKTLSTLLPSFQQEADLIQKLSHLETKVASMQEQLTGLALELLQERTLRYEQRLQTLETLIQPTQRPEALLQALQTVGGERQQEEGARKEPRLHPAELRARSRVIPLIEYGAAGTYVVICPQQGELQLTPDSPAWFDWLATLSSFRFVGQQGRFSAYRKSSTSRSWSAYRTIHQHDYRHYLGTTDHLTIACFEQVAATLHSYMPLL